MAATTTSKELLDGLLEAEHHAEDIIAVAKKNRLAKLKQAKGEAEEELGPFRQEQERKFRAEAAAKATAGDMKLLDDATRVEIEKVQRDYASNKDGAIAFIVGAVLDVSCGLSTTQKQALTAEADAGSALPPPSRQPAPPPLSQQNDARLKEILSASRVKLVMKQNVQKQDRSPGTPSGDEFEARLDLNETIDFKTQHHGDEVNPEFKDEPKAKAILKDVAGILKLYPDAVLRIEGHTATPDSKMDQWAHKLAEGRADIVRDTIVSFGVPIGRLRTCGLPGKFGTGKHDTILKVISF